MARIKSFSGCIFLAEVDDDGNTTSNWETPGEVQPLSLQITEEIIKVKGRTCLTNGKIIGTKSKPADATGSMTLHEITARTVAKALKGLISTRSVTESTLTASAVTLGGLGEFVEIGKEDLSSIIVQDATDTTTYVEGVDYQLEPTLGLIAPLKAALEDTTVHISGTSAANTDQRVTIAAGASKKYAIKGKLVDDYTQEVVKLYLRKVLLVLQNEINFVSAEDTDHEQLDFELAPEIPTGQTDYGTIDGLPLY